MSHESIKPHTASNIASYKKVVNVYIVYDTNLWTFRVGKCFVLGNSLFWAVGSTTNAGPDEFQYSGDGTGFDSRGSFFVSDGKGSVENVIIFCADVSSSVHVDDRKSNILIFGEGPTQG